MKVRVRRQRRAPVCPLCRKPVPRGWDLSWPAVIGTMVGVWRGYLWVPGGYAHERCVDDLASRGRYPL